MVIVFTEYRQGGLVLPVLQLFDSIHISCVYDGCMNGILHHLTTVQMELEIHCTQLRIQFLPYVPVIMEIPEYLLAGIVLSAVGVLIVRPAAALLGAEGEMLDYAVRYGRLLMLSLPFFILQNMFQSFFVTAEKPHLGFAFTVAAGVTNMVLDVVLVGMLHGGVEGAAIATFISQAVGGVLPVFYFLNKRSTSSIHLGRAQWNGGVIRSACINGSSELMTNLSMSLVNILYNYQLLRFAGENGVAAYGVIMYAAFLFVAVFVGYAVGSAPIVSYHYGARNHAELNNLYSKSLRLIGVIAVVMTALSMLVIPYVARIFVGYDAELLALTSHAFRVYALNFFLMGFNVYGSSFFTALGDGVTSALISFLRTLLFQLLEILNSSGAFDGLTVSLMKHCKSPRSGELICYLVAALGSVVTGGSGIAIVFFGSLVRRITKAFHIDRCRGANILDGVACGATGLMPHGNPTLVSLGVALAIDGVDPNFSFLDIIPYNFHCWGLMLIFLLSILTGIGRRFEKPEETANA